MRKTSAAESGFTMVELLITMLVVGIVAGSLIAVFLALQRSQSFSEDRSEALDEMRLAMENMTKEIRQATSIAPSSGAFLLDMDTYVLGVSKHVVYQVSGDRLTRREGSGAAVVVAPDLDLPYPPSQGVFEYVYPAGGTPADALVVSILLRVHPPKRPDTTLELRSEVRLRNRSRA